VNTIVLSRREPRPDRVARVAADLLGCAEATLAIYEARAASSARPRATARG
jgi:hypothetical protein